MPEEKEDEYKGNRYRDPHDPYFVFWHYQTPWLETWFSFPELVRNFMSSIINEHMKSSKAQNKKTNTQFNANKHRPENKDNLDSRAGAEQEINSGDITHNKKQTKSAKKNTQY